MRTVLYRLSIVLLGVIMLGLSLGGCLVSATTTFQSRTNLVDMVPITSLIIVSDVWNPVFDVETYHGFQAGLSSRLATCGIQSQIIEPSALELDLAGRIARATESSSSTTVLYIHAEGGSITHRGEALEGKLNFKLKIIDVTANKMLWLSTAHLDYTNSIWTNEGASGVRFATSIVAQLRDDRVLTHCPPATAPWPDVVLGPQRK